MSGRTVVKGTDGVSRRFYTHVAAMNIQKTPGMGSSRTVLDLSRTKNRGLGLGLDKVWPWPWPRRLVLYF